VHNAAWSETFDAYLRRRSAQTGEPFRPFDPHDDYTRYVDGRPRADGVRTFLASRGITIDEGSPDDPPDADTVNGLGNRKNVTLLRRIREDGVKVFDGSLAYVSAARQAGLACAVVSASANTPDILKITKLGDFMDAVVDGNVAREVGLRGKPQPDTFLHAADLLGVPPADAAVFEDAIAGVAAGRAGAFGHVVGVDRVGRGHREELVKAGADVVVDDLAELLA
jgi:HAD superfamily hydrolase (TIGR01509 family)